MKGIKCDEIESGFYCPAIDHLTYEATNAVKFNSEATLVEDSNLFTYPNKFGYLGTGRRVLVKEGGEITMIIEKTEISGFFEILLRYQSIHDWRVNLKINALTDKYSLLEETCDRYFYQTSFTIQNGKLNFKFLKLKFLCFFFFKKELITKYQLKSIALIIGRNMKLFCNLIQLIRKVNLVSSCF